jgi:hypothetical protein
VINTVVTPNSTGVIIITQNVCPRLVPWGGARQGAQLACCATTQNLTNYSMYNSSSQKLMYYTQRMNNNNNGTSILLPPLVFRRNEEDNNNTSILLRLYQLVISNSNYLYSPSSIVIHPLIA